MCSPPFPSFFPHLYFFYSFSSFHVIYIGSMGKCYNKSQHSCHVAAGRGLRYCTNEKLIRKTRVSPTFALQNAQASRKTITRNFMLGWFFPFYPPFDPFSSSPFLSNPVGYFRSRRLCGVSPQSKVVLWIWTVLRYLERFTLFLVILATHHYCRISPFCYIKPFC